MTLTEMILSDERLVAILIGVLLVLVLYTRGVRPRTAQRLEVVRGVLWRALDKPARGAGRPLIRDKTDDEEYVATVDVSLEELQQALFANGWSWNPISTKKYRKFATGRRQWTVGTWVYRDRLFADGQHHVYIFEHPDRDAFNIYAHYEANILSKPREHVQGPWDAGDPYGIVRDTLDDAGIERVKSVE